MIEQFGQWVRSWAANREAARAIQERNWVEEFEGDLARDRETAEPALWLVRIGSLA